LRSLDFSRNKRQTITNVMDEQNKSIGSASIQSRLWSARAQDWAETQEAGCRSLFDAVLKRLGAQKGLALLDVGCGAGMAAQMAAALGARVTGIDASADLIAIAKQQLPTGDFTVGEMEALPYADHSFDAITGFNSFQYAASPINALREARRVAKTGASIAVATWGKPADCEAAVYLAALRELMPPAPPGAPGPFALSEDGALQALVHEAGLTPVDGAEVECAWVYPDLQTALRGLLSSGPAVKAIETSGAERMAQAVTEVLAPFKKASGSYQLRNKFRYLIASA
jgi:ubiquinone/menaquinone biosynthesis C-methylase UbiE